ncbi:hypothetical protein OPV22_021572 [Ensete ventricosum]|uniref:Sodium/hydrogen exchanger n=1 Tax=Ensete ventricosum TaxID=4639 RepID=A0AAV8PB80_ENSVE|nr:hypothetical protein OPV22_021572 [Ensete ventricosum]
MLELNATASPPGSTPPEEPGEDQQAAGVGILLQISMLVLSFVVGHVLRRHKFYYLPEASVSLLIGLVVGGIANISHTEANIRGWFNFHEEFFFLFLLPPIIFQSGFSLAPKPFFSNFGAIITLAILGTFIASVVTGILVYLGGLAYLMYKLPLVECLMFGALVSATDPVTVLSIFQELGTDVNIYALVFGESVLNDAMAISLYRTMSSVRSSKSSGQSLALAVLKFLETFFGSMSSGLDVDNLHNLESCLFVLFPYFSYMLAEGLGLSGIVSILFTGIVMKQYTFSNLSKNSQHFAPAFFHLLSSLAETFVFIYMGFDIAMEQHSWSHIGFIFFSILFIGVARAAHVFSCAWLINMVRPTSSQIPMRHQKALWYSGLRGAMAFALALKSVHDLPDGHGKIILTATTAIVVITVLLIGGSTGKMLEALEVIGDAYSGPYGEENLGDNHDYVGPSLDEGSSSGNKIRMKLKKIQSTASFTALDRNYLTPIFTSKNDVSEEAPENSRTKEFQVHQ